MKKSLSSFKVRYAETDQMGVVHHANYALYLEAARLDWLNQFGISYKKMEEEGIFLPVYELSSKYIKSAFFDDEITVETSLREKPGVKIIFDYVIYNNLQEIIHEANITLVFMDAKSKRPIKCPGAILKAMGF
jgi:acyl-CoA thioester hydrolase